MKTRGRRFFSRCRGSEKKTPRTDRRFGAVSFLGKQTPLLGGKGFKHGFEASKPAEIRGDGADAGLETELLTALAVAGSVT